MHGLHKIKIASTARETIQKGKPREWERISASYTSDRGLISRPYKKLKKRKKKEKKAQSKYDPEQSGLE